MSAQQIQVRPAGLGDQDQVWPLARDLATSYVPERPAFGRSFVLLLADADALVLVAERPGGPDGEVVGYLLATSHPAFHANRTPPFTSRKLSPEGRSGAVDVPAVAHVDHSDDTCAVVDAIDDPVGAPPGGESVVQRWKQALPDPMRLAQQRAGHELVGCCGNRLGQGLG
jgi:hypothetical protein